MKSLIDRLARFKLGRWLMGGHWCKIEGRWLHCDVTLVRCSDGSVFYSFTDDDGSTSSFHETFVGIEAREVYDKEFRNLRKIK